MDGNSERPLLKLKIAEEEVELVDPKPLGEGAFAKVFAYKSIDDKYLAVKYFKLPEIKEEKDLQRVRQSGDFVFLASQPNNS